MSSDKKDLPPRPRLTLRVGVTGKRAVPGTEVARVLGALASVFEALAVVLAKCRDDHQAVLSEEPVLLRIICGMAEGADQLAAEVALERFEQEEADKSSKVRTRLAAILPFAKKEYEKDFERDANKVPRTPAQLAAFVADFEKMLDHPATEDVLEIDDETILGTANPNDRNLAYPRLAEALLEHTDVLVAVSDDVDGGAGGTVDVMRIAAREGIPVIKISTKDAKICSVKAADVDAPDQFPPDDMTFDALPQLPKDFVKTLNTIIAPPSTSGDSPHGAHGTGRARLEQYLHEGFAPAKFGWLFKAFRDAMLGRFWCALPNFIRSARGYQTETPAQKLAGLWFPQDGETCLVATACNPKFRKIHMTRYVWADTLAVNYADATRSSYIAIAALGAIAVLIGLSALFSPDEWSLHAKVGALLAEGFILYAAGKIFFRRAHDERWHERMVEYRALAELLRHQRFVCAFGAADRLERTADRAWREPDAWVGWYVRATLRELGFPTVKLSAQYRYLTLKAFQRDELQEQQAYNKLVAARFTKIDERLSYLVQRAWAFAVGAALLGAILLATLHAIEVNHWCGHEYAETLLEYLKPSFTVLMAFLPAVIAAVHGVRFQMEFSNTAERTASTGRELKQLTDSLGDIRPAPGRHYCLYYVRRANEAMSADLAGWSNVYRGKAPEPP